MPSSRPLEKTATRGIYKRGNRYVVIYRDHQGRQRKRAAETLTQARDLKASLRTDVRRGEYRDASRETFADYAPRWIDTYQGRTSRGIQAHTIADYRSYLERYAVPYFGKLRLAEITPQDIKAFAAAVGQGAIEGRTHKGSSVRAILAPLKALFADAFEEGLIRGNPTAGVRIVAQQTLEEEDDAAEVKALTAEQLAALLDRTPEAWRLFFRFLADTGVRIGEAIELRWKDVDIGTGKVQIRRKFYRGQVGPPKSRYGVRTVRLTADLSRALWTLRKDNRSSDEDLVFTAEQGARVDGSNLMSRVLKPAAREADIGGWVGFHTFRHTCATTLFREGWNAVQVQRWLGHHKPSFTIDTYIHLLEDDTPEPINVSGGNKGATRADETGRNGRTLEAVEMAV